MTLHCAAPSCSRAGTILILLLLVGAFPGPLAHAGNRVWTSGGPFGKSIKDLLDHPTKPNVLYAGTFGRGVYKSTDGGVTWDQHRTGFRNSFVRCLAMDTARPETLYAGTNDGLYRSYDGASTWVLLLDAAALGTPTSVRAVTPDKRNPGTIYVGTYDDGIFKSVDYGAHWTPINLGLTNTSLRCISIHPLDSDTVLAGTGTNGGVFSSADGGLSWTQSPDTAASASAAEKIVYDLEHPTRIYVATGSHGVIVSTNGGATWGRLARGLTSFLTRSLAVIDTVRYVGTDTSGVFFATLSDTLWHAASSGLTNRQVDALLARSRTEVWAGTDGGGAFHTLNAAGTWTQVDGGLLLTNVQALGISQAAGYVYSATGLGDLFWSSTDQGATWTQTSGLSNTHSSEQGIANEPGSPSTIYLAITDVGVLKSLDNGSTWTNPDPAGTLNGQPLAALVSHPVLAGVLYVGGSRGVYKTSTGGASWAPINSGLPANAHVKALALGAMTPDTVFAGTDSVGVYVSLNGGSSWTHVGPGIPAVYVRAVVCDPTNAGVVYAATDSGVFRSANNGSTWFPSSTGLPASISVRALAYDPTHPNVWFAGIRGAGVFWSPDAGASWRPLTYGLGGGSLNVNALAVDAVHATVYAGTESSTFQLTNYPTSNVGVNPADLTRLSFTSSPNPFHGSVDLQFTVHPLERVGLEIFDIAGRRVRRLLSRARTSAGSWNVSWDGRDDRGFRLPEGVYLAQLSDAAGPRSLRLVLMR